MKFFTISSFVLIVALPLLLFLAVLNFVALDDEFYQKKFSEYGVPKNVPDAISLHEDVMKFMRGSTNELPNAFNEREKQHLRDVGRLLRISAFLMYICLISFVFLLVISANSLKSKNLVADFTGKVFLIGGILTMAAASIIFIFLKSDFSSAFDLFHQLLFRDGTYTFDPAKEIIVNLYPQQLFMDLGARLSKGIIIASLASILLGLFLILKSKKQKLKYD